MLLKLTEIKRFGLRDSVPSVHTLDEMDEMNAETVKVCELLDAIALDLPAYKYFKRITEVIEAVDDETLLSVYWDWDRVIIRDVKELIAQLDEAIRLGHPSVWRSTHWSVVDHLVKQQLGIRGLIYEDEDGELVGPPRSREDISAFEVEKSGREAL